MNQAIIDYYRCPEDAVDFRLAGTLSDDPGYFRFGAQTICYGNSSSGTRGNLVSDTLYDALPDSEAYDGLVYLPFDPDEIIENLRYEHYRIGADRARLGSVTIRSSGICIIGCGRSSRF